jgi:hypothetical protein
VTSALAALLLAAGAGDDAAANLHMEFQLTWWPGKPLVATP